MSIPKQNRIRLEKKVRSVTIIIIIILVVIIMLIPIYWMISTSFKYSIEASHRPPTIIPKNFTIDNYLTVLHNGALRPILNSTIIAVSVTILSLIIGVFAAYGIARFNIGGNFISKWILSTRMFPPVATAIPIVIIMSRLGLIDNYLALIIAHTTFNLPFVIWLLRSFFMEIPRGLDEAAVVDGCSYFGAFFRIILPISTSGIVVAGIFSFLFSWNEFLFALLLTRRVATTFPLAVASLSGSQGIDWGQACSLAILGTLPAIIIIFIFQKYLIRGLTAGMIKE